MCGIAGFIGRSDESRVSAERARAVIDLIRHRGPDAQGEYHDTHVWFGHVRLSIIDLSDCARQPMTSADARFVICYNGETYNFRDLVTELSLDNLRSRSDTEVVLRAFAARGAASFPLLKGMFAFAIYDREAQKVWLVRDRLGIKPLYYRLDGSGLAFASEIKAILALGDRAPVCDVSSLHEWLYYGNALGGHTLHQGIRQLLPGHSLELDLRTFAVDIRAYWSVRQQATAAPAAAESSTAIVAETRRLLDRAVERQLVADVPVGVFLSGGVDSTAITALASRHYNGRLTTYSAGFDDSNGVDERPKAARIAKLYGTDHHEIQVGGGDVADLVERMVRHHDLPFSDAANIPLYLMAATISGRTKVVLQGDGGDEVFGGYRRYVTLRYRRWLHALAVCAAPFTRRSPQSARQQRVLRYLHAFAAVDIGSTMALLLTLEDARSRPASVFAPPFRRLVEQSDPFARYRECQQSVAAHDIGNQMSLVDLMIELPDVFLEKVDRATMAASLEVRVPFLDEDLVDFVVRIPGRVKMPRGQKKWLLKQALAGIVPDDVLYGPKTGFSVPFGYWIRTTLRPFFRDHLATFARAQPGVLDVARLDQLYADTERGRGDHTYLLWKVLNLMVWCNTGRVQVAA